MNRAGAESVGDMPKPDNLSSGPDVTIVQPTGTGSTDSDVDFDLQSSRASADTPRLQTGDTPEIPKEGASADISFGTRSRIDAALATEQREYPVLPTTMGDLRRIRLLGSGGMGDVYLAHLDTPQGSQHVVVKINRQNHGPAMKRFGREARIMEKLTHERTPLTPEFLGEGTAVIDGQDRPFIVMKYVPGRDLDEIIEATGPLPPKTAASIAFDIALCLYWGTNHPQRISHRDLKAKNVMVDHTGQVYVFDFGLGKMQDATQHTGTYQIMGTVSHMAPEVFEQGGVKYLDGNKLDAYALGVIVEHLLRGKFAMQEATRQLDANTAYIRAQSMHAQGEVWVNSRTLAGMTAEETPSQEYEAMAGLINRLRIRDPKQRLGIDQDLLYWLADLAGIDRSEVDTAMANNRSESVDRELLAQLQEKARGASAAIAEAIEKNELRKPKESLAPAVSNDPDVTLDQPAPEPEQTVDFNDVEDTGEVTHFVENLAQQPEAELSYEERKAELEVLQWLMAVQTDPEAAVDIAEAGKFEPKHLLALAKLCNVTPEQFLTELNFGTKKETEHGTAYRDNIEKPLLLATFQERTLPGRTMGKVREINPDTENYSAEELASAITSGYGRSGTTHITPKLLEPIPELQPMANTVDMTLQPNNAVETRKFSLTRIGTIATGVVAACIALGVAAKSYFTPSDAEGAKPVLKAPELPEVAVNPYKPNAINLIRENGELKSLVLVAANDSGTLKFERKIDDNASYYLDEEGAISGGTMNLGEQDRMALIAFCNGKLNGEFDGVADYFFSKSSPDTLFVLQGVGLVLSNGNDRVIIPWEELLQNKSNPRIAEFLANTRNLVTIGGGTLPQTSMRDAANQLKLYKKRLGASPASSTPQVANTNGGSN